MPLYFLSVGNMENVLRVHEYRRGLNARSLDKYVSALPLCYIPPYLAVQFSLWIFYIKNALFSS